MLAFSTGGRSSAGGQANERMQLTWLTGASSRPVSVHRRAVEQYGLGSPATQLMRAVRRAAGEREMMTILAANALQRPAPWFAFWLVCISVASCSPVVSPTEVPSPEPTRQLETYQPVDWFELKYDPKEWSATNDDPETSWVIDWSRLVLANQLTDGCYVGANVPRDFGPGIVLRDTEVRYGERDMRLTELLDIGTQKPIPARIYGDDIAVEYGDEKDGCLQAVEVVMETYRSHLP